MLLVLWFWVGMWACLQLWACRQIAYVTYGVVCHFFVVGCGHVSLGVDLVIYSTAHVKGKCHTHVTCGNPLTYTRE